MSESDTASVECPLCGEAFDPTAAGGWCTNSDCGEWQYETDVTPDQSEESGDEPTDGDANAAGPGVADDAADEGPDAGVDDDSDGSSAPDTADDADEPEATDESPADESPSDGSQAAPSSAGGSGDVATFDCPGCGSTLDADVNFCPDCGEDVSALPVEESSAEPELDACPSCGADVDADDNFCVSCGEDLSAHRGAADLSACPDCGADVDADDGFCAGCGADLDAHRTDAGADDDSGTGDDTGGDDGTGGAPDALALAAHGRSVVVEDGDAVGREIRSLLTESGRPEDEAVRVHREHVRFVREAGQFYLVDLGANPTRLNGRALSKGDREPVGPGDELELSDVVTLTVEAA